MVQLIAFIIFVVSVAGVIFILWKKTPALLQLPQNGHNSFKKPALVVKIEKKLKEKHFHLFEKRMLLHKILSKVLIWVLKIERKIGEKLHIIRKNAQEIDKKNGKKPKN